MTGGGERRDTVALSPSFFSRSALSVARELLGCEVVSLFGGGLTSGIITETEAYAGVLDRACHAFAWHRTPRVESMYAAPGTAYVYLVYGLHNCLNVSCATEGNPHAVLIRGLRPLRGVDEMARRRGLGTRAIGGEFPNPRLADGPGKLSVALGVDRSADGIDLTDSAGPLFIAPGGGSPSYRSSSRVGIDYSGEFARFRWRFLLD